MAAVEHAAAHDDRATVLTHAQCRGSSVGYVFPTWRDALADSQRRIADAYEHRARLFKAAQDAGLSLREIGEAAGITGAAVHKIVGKQRRATLDDQTNR